VTTAAQINLNLTAFDSVTDSFPYFSYLGEAVEVAIHEDGDYVDFWLDKENGLKEFLYSHKNYQNRWITASLVFVLEQPPLQESCVLAGQIIRVDVQKKHTFFRLELKMSLNSTMKAINTFQKVQAALENDPWEDEVDDDQFTDCEDETEEEASDDFELDKFIADLQEILEEAESQEESEEESSDYFIDDIPLSEFFDVPQFNNHHVRELSERTQSLLKFAMEEMLPSRRNEEKMNTAISSLEIFYELAKNTMPPVPES
jgi:hypothetical protein